MPRLTLVLAPSLARALAHAPRRLMPGSARGLMPGSARGLMPGSGPRLMPGSGPGRGLARSRVLTRTMISARAAGRGTGLGRSPAAGAAGGFLRRPQWKAARFSAPEGPAMPDLPGVGRRLIRDGPARQPVRDAARPIREDVTGWAAADGSRTIPGIRAGSPDRPSRLCAPGGPVLRQGARRAVPATAGRAPGVTNRADTTAAPTVTRVAWVPGVTKPPVPDMSRPPPPDTSRPSAHAKHSRVAGPVLGARLSGVPRSRLARCRGVPRSP